MTNVIEWKRVESRIGPNTTYGYWNEAKVFSIYYDGMTPAPKNAPRYVIKSMLPGFRPDLPKQNSEADAKVFLERMLQRWVAKRGLLFKANVIVTDAMKAAASQAFAQKFGAIVELGDAQLEVIIKAAIEAREPHAATGAKPR